MSAPTTMPARVYLNRDFLHDPKALADGCLYPVLRFELPVPAGAPPSAAAITDTLETVFEQLNIDEPTETWALKYRLAGHRSLSVGDVVCIGETAWAVDISGWQTITSAQLAAAAAV